MRQTVGGFERILGFTRAYDRRSSDPKKNYGCHGVDMRFVLKGPKGAIQFLLYTGWHLPGVAEELGPRQPMPADLGYHSPHPMYESQSVVRDECEYVGGGPCYYDGSTLNAKEPFDILVTEGEEALWAFLEGDYARRFSE